MAKFCTNCGKALPENAAFCPQCGKPATAQEATPEAPKPAPARKAAAPRAPKKPAPAPEKPALPANGGGKRGLSCILTVIMLIELAVAGFKYPGFLLPPGVDKRDCFIRFPGRDALSYFNVNAAGFALPESPRRLTLDGGLAPYGADMPDTWIFAGQDIREVGIALPDGKPYVTLRCGQFPMLGVWANPNGPFICLEPWFGRTDDVGFAGTIAEKPGIQRLAPGAAMEMGYSIEFHSACH